MAVMSDLRSSRALLANLTAREIKGKYKRTVLGQAWSLLNPLAQMATYTAVFSLVLRNSPPPGDPSGLDVFALWLTSGLLPWLFFANTVTIGMGSLIANANLIQKVYFPRITLVISSMLALLFTFAIELVVLIVILVGFGGNPLPYLPVTIFFVLLLAAFALGVALVFAVANVYFRDTQHLVGIGLQMLFYLTPIIYPISIIAIGHDQYVFAYRLNPLERFTEIFRNTLYDGRWPSLTNTGYAVAAAMIMLAIGIMVFHRFEGRMAEEL